MRRINVVATTALVTLLSLAAAGVASAETARFSIQPAQAATDPRAASFFSYTLPPGITRSDAAVVSNHGSAALALIVYSADGVTATNGGTAFAANGQHRDGTHAWIALEAARITVPAGSKVSVPFTIHVPTDATPGDHIAGIVVEAPPTAGSATGVSAAIVQRAGVAVAVRVGGPAAERLALGELCLNQESGSNYFQLVASNRGQLFTRASGTFSLVADGGRVVFERPVELGTIIPGDAAFVRLDAPSDPGPGRYTAALSLKQLSGELVALSTPIAITATKANGCRKADAAPPPAEPRAASAQIGAADVAGGPPLLAVAATSALLAASLAGIAVWRLRR